MKHLTMTLFIILFLNTSPSMAEPPEVKEMRDEGGTAGQWQAEQYERAERLEQQGEYEKADEVREYADQRVEQGARAANAATTNSN